MSNVRLETNGLAVLGMNLSCLRLISSIQIDLWILMENKSSLCPLTIFNNFKGHYMGLVSLTSQQSMMTEFTCALEHFTVQATTVFCLLSFLEDGIQSQSQPRGS